MSGISQILTTAYNALLSLTLDVSLYIAWGIYAAIFLLAFIFTLCNADARRSETRAFLSFTNAFAAVTLALMLTEKELPISLLTAVVFWCVGYLLYGLLVIASKRKKRVRQTEPSAMVAAASAPPKERFAPSVQPAKGNVRLEHALSVTEKLLARDLGRGDRQEAERIKTLLCVLMAKPELSPEENDRLNDNFNTLLKLMAKYNV